MESTLASQDVGARFSIYGNAGQNARQQGLACSSNRSLSNLDISKRLQDGTCDDLECGGLGPVPVQRHRVLDCNSTGVGSPPLQASSAGWCLELYHNRFSIENWFRSIVPS